MSYTSVEARQQLLDAFGEAADNLAHALAALKILFRFCVRRHLLDTTPMDRIERLGRPKSRERVLSAAFSIREAPGTIGVGALRVVVWDDHGQEFEPAVQDANVHSG